MRLSPRPECCRVPGVPPPTPAAPFVAVTIWTALALYAAGEYGRTRRPPAAWARPVWLAGALAYLAHVAAAFAVHHDWSHAAARSRARGTLRSVTQGGHNGAAGHGGAMPRAERARRGRTPSRRLPMAD